MLHFQNIISSKIDAEDSCRENAKENAKEDAGDEGDEEGGDEGRDDVKTADDASNSNSIKHCDTPSRIDFSLGSYACDETTVSKD